MGISQATSIPGQLKLQNSTTSQASDDLFHPNNNPPDNFFEIGPDDPFSNLN